MNLGVIPARGGSKRIPRKNIKSFADRPIIAWSIAAALESRCFDRLIVSTDDEEIAQVARESGAEVPFLRPPELSNDHAGTIPVMRHAIEWQASIGVPADLVCCIYATAPFLGGAEICQGLAALKSGAKDFAFSVAKYPAPIQRALRIDQQGRVAMFNPSQFHTRSQDLEEAYYDAAQFYWGRSAAWRTANTLFGPTSSPILLASHRVQDIDTPEDWTRAEWMFRAQQAAT